MKTPVKKPDDKKADDKKPKAKPVPTNPKTKLENVWLRRRKKTSSTSGIESTRDSDGPSLAISAPALAAAWKFAETLPEIATKIGPAITKFAPKIGIDPEKIIAPEATPETDPATPIIEPVTASDEPDDSKTPIIEEPGESVVPTKRGFVTPTKIPQTQAEIDAADKAAEVENAKPLTPVKEEPDEAATVSPFAAPAMTSVPSEPSRPLTEGQRARGIDILTAKLLPATKVDPDKPLPVPSSRQLTQPDGSVLPISEVGTAEPLPVPMPRVRPDVGAAVAGVPEKREEIEAERETIPAFMSPATLGPKDGIDPSEVEALSFSPSDTPLVPTLTPQGTPRPKWADTLDTVDPLSGPEAQREWSLAVNAWKTAAAQGDVFAKNFLSDDQKSVPLGPGYKPISQPASAPPQVDSQGLPQNGSDPGEKARSGVSDLGLLLSGIPQSGVSSSDDFPSATAGEDSAAQTALSSPAAGAAAARGDTTRSVSGDVSSPDATGVGGFGNNQGDGSSSDVGAALSDVGFGAGISSPSGGSGATHIGSGGSHFTDEENENLQQLQQALGF